jgi:hypothetical protein
MFHPSVFMGSKEFFHIDATKDPFEHITNGWV